MSSIGAISPKILFICHTAQNQGPPHALTLELPICRISCAVWRPRPMIPFRVSTQTEPNPKKNRKKQVRLSPRGGCAGHDSRSESSNISKAKEGLVVRGNGKSSGKKIA